MKLIVGLGNPEEKYKNTRHNVGFSAIDLVIPVDDWHESEKATALYARPADLEDVEFLKPLTFMNKSGSAVAYASTKHKIKPEHILVIHDDLDIEVGRVKMTFAKSSGGHKGVESIVKALKTEKFWRLRIGIAPRRKPDHKKMKEWILSSFTPAEKKLVLKNKKKILEGIRLWTEHPEKGMQLLNSK